MKSLVCSVTATAVVLLGSVTAGGCSAETTAPAAEPSALQKLATQPTDAPEPIELGIDVHGKNIGPTVLGQRVQVIVGVSDTPYDTATGFKAGPAAHLNRYGQSRRFFPVFDNSDTGKGNIGVVWQAPTSGRIYATWVGDSLVGNDTVELQRPPKTALAAATSDDKGTIYYLCIEEGDHKSGTKKVWMLAAGPDGARDNELDGSKATLNITQFGSAKGSSNQAALVYSGGDLGLIVARKMHKAKDGLNHQGAIAAVIDAKTLQIRKKLGQTSSHSFEVFLDKAHDGRFIGIDLADNYPRGVHLHRFDAAKRHSRVVYTFKTKHGTKANNPAGKKYDAYVKTASGKQLYKWSNDNSTYTELGGVVHTGKGLLVVFASEADKLDNAKALALHNAPRNLATVLVRPDFETVAKGKGASWVSDELMLSKSDYTMEGGYYSFGGKWLSQRNSGVAWHTDYTNKNDNCSRVKIANLLADGVAVLWERWTAKSYVETHAMILGGDGSVMAKPQSLGKKLRLGRREDPFVSKQRAVVVSGDAKAKALVFDVFLPKGRLQ